MLARQVACVLLIRSGRGRLPAARSNGRILSAFSIHAERNRGRCLTFMI